MLYTLSSSEHAAAELFSRIFESEPETAQRNMRSGVTATIATGTIREFQSTISVQFGRVDLLMAYLDSGRASIDALPVEPLVDAAVKRATALLDSVSSTRVAIVLDVFEPVDSESQAHERIKAELDFLRIEPNAREINFQVNVTRPFERDAAITMSRLCRWATGKMQLLSFNLDEVGGMSGAPQLVVERNVVALQVDVSPEPGQNEPLDNGFARDILAELGAETKAIVSQGYGRLAQ